MPPLPPLKLLHGVLVFGVACGALLGLRSTLFGKRLVMPNPPAQSPLTSPELTLYYHERRPYYFKKDGQLTGIVVDRAVAALHHAGISYRWEILPPARQLERIRDSAAPIGAIGWFVSDERRKFAQFSAPIFQGEPFVIIARANDERFAALPSLETLLTTPTLTLLVRDSYSYGPKLDPLLARHQPTTFRTPVDSVAQLRLITTGRADYLFASHSEARALLDRAHGELSIIELAGLPMGEPRHLMFSQAVPAETIDRLNRAILELSTRGRAATP